MAKKILYFSNSRFPVAALAGAIHTGRLSLKKQDTGNYPDLPFLNIRSGGEGEIFVMGRDEWGNDVYALSVKGERGMPYRLVDSFLRIYQINRGNVLVVDSGVGDNWFLLTGRLLGRLGFPAPLGRFFTCAGIKKLYGELSRLIAEVKALLGKSLD
jgi:hypothetical protein